MSIPQMEPNFTNVEARAVYKYMKSGGWVMEYKKTKELENMIAKFTKAKYCCMTTNGTIALILSLLALDLKPNDQVIVPNLTMIATPNACSFLGIKPLLVDIDPKTLCVDLDKAKRLLNKNVKAMIYVSLNGRSGNMEEVVEFCRKNNLFLIEDAAQSLGSSWKGKALGTFGDIGCLSFSVPKIITTGQGGAILTNKASLYQRLMRLKNFGRENSGGNIHNYWGWNFRFTDIQAVIGIEQMEKLPRRIKRKKNIYKRYMSQLGKIKQIEIIPTNIADTCPWFIDIYISSPNKLASYLKAHDIGTRRVYPPIHRQKIYKKEYINRKFPVSIRYSSRGLWLPSSSKLTNSQVDHIAKLITNFYNEE